MASNKCCFEGLVFPGSLVGIFFLLNVMEGEPTLVDSVASK